MQFQCLNRELPVACYSDSHSGVKALYSSTASKGCWIADCTRTSAAVKLHAHLSEETSRSIPGVR